MNTGLLATFGTGRKHSETGIGIRSHMAEKRRDLIPFIGSRAKVSEIGVRSSVPRWRSAPEIGTAVSPREDVRRSLVGRFPYQVVYRLQPNEITIVAVAHMKRRPGYWTRRR